MSNEGPSLAEILTPGGDEPRRGVAPRLPIEGPLVRGVRELEGLKAQVDGLLLLLERCPDQHAMISAASDAMVSRTNAAVQAIWQFQQVRSCEGQG